NGLWVGASTNPPYELVVQDLSSAQYYYQLSALATDSSGANTWSLPVQFYVVPPPPPRPINDDFANRLALVGAPLLVTGSNATASRQPDEPLPPESSTWYSWTATNSSPCTIIATGPTWWPPALAIFTGSSLAQLTEIALGTNWAGSVNAIFDAVAGTTYQI